MNIKVILMTDGDWCIGDSYAEALEKLDRYVNDDYYREMEENGGKHSDVCIYEKEEVEPKVMILTDDPEAYIDRYGAVRTKGGFWTLQVPLATKHAPVPNYRFSLMQQLKDKDFKEELENHLIAMYGAEFDSWCQKRSDGLCEGCVFNDVEHNDNGEPTCFHLWYEKYKKPEKEDK
jgi:hypothetical protein